MTSWKMLKNYDLNEMDKFGGQKDCLAETNLLFKIHKTKKA